MAQVNRGVVPGQVTEGLRDGAEVFPGNRNPAALPVVADPDPVGVIGVAVDLPQIPLAGDTGGLSPRGSQLRAVIDAVVELDAVGVDGPPGRGQQFDVVVPGERERDVAGVLDEAGVLLVRRESPAGTAGVPQSVMAPVLPLGFTDRDLCCS
ncbi:hypothetical protein [Streptomyces sp. NPDC048527]|uniref:hypothetical protein n=1 Tax=Streptomyces sp. NPDC048527 TaxID=3365568 RepID=UPI003720B9B2